MAWVKVDDGLFENRKIRAAGPLGTALYVAGLCHCATQLSDGVIAKDDLPLLLAKAKVTRGVVGKLTQVVDGEARPLWEERLDCFVVPDYLVFNPSRADVLASREGAKERRARGGRASPDASRDGPAMFGNPVPSPQDQDLSREPFGREFLDLWPGYPRKIAKKQAFRAYQATRRRGIETTDLTLAVKHYAQECELEHRETRYIKHGATFFGPSEPWRDYVEAPKPSIPTPGAVVARPDFSRGKGRA